MRTLLTSVFATAAALSMKCSADLIMHSHRFPRWFVPAFVLGIAGLLLLGALVVLRFWRRSAPPRWASGRPAVLIWVVLCLSFICTSAVHGFYPFRPARPTVFLELDPILQWNMLLTALGFAASACCAVLYLGGRQRGAVLALLVLGLVLLVPNDACKNTFNRWWIAHLGASPLMFVPNQFAIVFGSAALTGLDRRLTTAALCVVALSVGLLGLGHMWRVIW